jgi:hypothetical protein
MYVNHNIYFVQQAMFVHTDENIHAPASDVDSYKPIGM